MRKGIGMPMVFFTKSVSTTSEIVPGSQAHPEENSGGAQLLSIATTRARS